MKSAPPDDERQAAGANTAFDRLEFRDPARVKALCQRLEELCGQMNRQVSIMHVCGSHEQAIARFGLRSLLPERLNVIMGPGCPVCITDTPEVDEAIKLARAGLTIATFGDMYRVPGRTRSLADAKAEGADVRIVYSPQEVLDLARSTTDPVIFFATGFETTAVTTAAAVLDNPPANFYVLSAHKYIPPAMEIVAEMPDTAVEGFLAAGHAAIITGCNVFERFVERHGLPVVVAGFEPLDILAALVRLVELIAAGTPAVGNAYPRCCTSEGNLQAQKLLWEVFRTEGGTWRGIAHVPNGNLRLRSRYARLDARERFGEICAHVDENEPPLLTQECICGSIMSGLSTPVDCRLFGRECTPATPVGACMVSSEGTCKIAHEYGGHLLVRDDQTSTPASGAVSTGSDRQ